MEESRQLNRRIVLASRPKGAPVKENFSMVVSSLPRIESGQILLKTIFLSLDPYMRGRMNDAPSYAPPVGIGEVMVGATVSRVEKSGHSEYREEEWVLSWNGWQEYAVSDGRTLIRLGMNPEHPSRALGILGMPGFTAYQGLLHIGRPKPGETLVVAAATGPVGSTVGQIAKMKGCRVVGVAGSAEKCSHATETFGFDVCLDHHAPDFSAQLRRACPDGIDIYFENVGGRVLNAVLPLLNANARIPVCGLASRYNATGLPEGPDRTSVLLATLLIKRVRMEGFIIFDHYESDYDGFHQDMAQWLKDGRIRFLEHFFNGLDQAPEAFISLLEGRCFGKPVVRVANGW